MPRQKSKILSTDTLVALLQILRSEETYQIINTTMCVEIKKNGEHLSTDTLGLQLLQRLLRRDALRPHSHCRLNSAGAD